MAPTTEERISVLEQQAKALTHSQQKQDHLLEEIHVVNLSIKEMNVNISMMQKIQEKTQKDLDELKLKNGVQWDYVVKAVLSAVAGGLVTFILIRLGLR